MRFESPQRPGWRDHRAELRRALAAGRLPMIGVPGAPDARIDGWDSTNDQLTCVSVRYGAEPDSWLLVETARWSGTGGASSPLRDVLEDHLRGAGVRFADVTWSESETPVSVDGRPMIARVLHAGADWWAARVILEAGLFGEVEVGLSAYRRDFPARLAILPGAEIAELLDAPMPGLGQLPPLAGGQGRAAPAEDDRGSVESPVPPGEPHRVLVDIVLRQARESAVWMAEGGPAPQLPATWGALWAAAVHRQSDLSGQSAEAADAAITDMLSQFTSLLSDAAWFRDDPALRHRAISETLLYVTGLAPNVPSRPAQQAWRSRQDARRPPAAQPDFDAMVQAEALWLYAWHTWTQPAK
jgi:hypothetical protein